MTRRPYYAPVFRSKGFNCNRCGVLASQRWQELTYYHQRDVPSGIWRCVCAHCGQAMIWTPERMLLPEADAGEPPHADMPEDVRAVYEEAAGVAPRSPRAAAALLRLAVQRLMPHLGQKGDNINSDIKSLVQKGLPSMIQQALDVCRVVGNNAVHPLEIDLDDSPEIALALFQMVNLIVEDRIARPKAIETAYLQLPEGARAAIEKRDGAALKSAAPQQLLGAGEAEEPTQ